MWGKSGNFAAEMEGKFIRPCFGLRPRRDFEERESDNHFLADKFFSDLRKCMDKIEAEQIIQKMENEIEFNIV